MVSGAGAEDVQSDGEQWVITTPLEALEAVREALTQAKLPLSSAEPAKVAKTPKVIEKGRYGAGFLAHLAVAKCADHLPLYRLEKDFARRGFPLPRSTMNRLIARAPSPSPVLAATRTKSATGEFVHQIFEPLIR